MGDASRMSTELQPITEQEHRAILNVCILAAFADGVQDDVERAKIQRIVEGFDKEHVDLTAAYQEALDGKLSLMTAAAPLQGAAARALAYEMAVGVCNADGVLKEPEKEFLAELRKALQLETPALAQHQETAVAIVAQPLVAATPPMIAATRDAELDKMILNAAILNGALELMPHTLATMAIVPLQMRLVYKVGHQYGYELDRGHIKDFLATVGVGLTSQVFEGYAQRLIRGLVRPLAGGLLGRLTDQAAGSAFAFATTYALGQVAKRYYAGGRRLDTGQLKEVFNKMLEDARLRQNSYSTAISDKARQINVSQLLPLVTQQ
jgi:uncharacterized protein (DUF697 family)/tellurite resistance protein